MFTGIVQTVGVVRSLRRRAAAAQLQIEAPALVRPLPPGSSVSVSGVCLTVTGGDERLVEFDVVPETLGRSTLGRLRPGDRVNLERSLRAGDPLDGHIVQGHVDGTARVVGIRRSGGERVWTFAPQDHLRPLIIPKGSIALDGVSLTVADLTETTFDVALIPTTLAATTLGGLRPGDLVNVETDVVVRTVVATLERWRKQGGAEPISLEMLRAHGW